MTLIELTNKITSSNPFPAVSGGPSHIQCPSCGTSYMGHKRATSLGYHCNECDHVFDISGKPLDKEGISDGGIFYRFHETSSEDQEVDKSWNNLSHHNPFFCKTFG